MTLDEAIKYYKHRYEESRNFYKYLLDIDEAQFASDYESIAEEHKQTAEWLTELKELRVKVIQLEKDYVELEEINSKHMWETDNLLDMAKEDYRTIMKLKRLLKLAVEDFVRIDEIKLLPENTIRPMLEYTNIIDIIKHKWRYADEAEKLIES